MTVCKNSIQNELKLPDGTIWVGKAEEPVQPGSHFYIGKNKRCWRILKIDQKMKRMLVITEELVCKRQFHNISKNSKWETCSLRSWLNGTFLHKEFDKEEQKAILTTHLEESHNKVFGTDSGKSTDDRLFLLSAEELQNYKQVFKDDQEGSWWLRTTGSRDCYGVYIKESNDVIYYGAARMDSLGVRPAMWIDMKSKYIQSLLVTNDRNELCALNPELIIKNGEVVHGSFLSTSVILPSYVKKIRKNAFNSCKELRSIAWTGEPPEIESGAFQDCSLKVLPAEYYKHYWCPSESLAAYMPYDEELMVKTLLNSRGMEGYWEKFIQYLTVENAVWIMDEALKRIKTIPRGEHCERLLRFALAASPVLGSVRLTKIRNYLKSVTYTGIQWQTILQREIEQTGQPAVIAKAVLRRTVVPADLLRTEWRELDRLPSFALVMYAAGEYAEQYSCGKTSGIDALPYHKCPEAEMYAGQLNHNAFMGLLRKWAKWISPRWYAPYAAYASDPEMAALLEEMKYPWNSKAFTLDISIRVKGAILLNDTVTAQRYADEQDMLGRYAEMRNMDEDEIRDSSISDFGLDVNGRRSWRVDGKTMTAAVNKDLTVTLTDENGEKYSEIPEFGENLLEYERIRLEYQDLLENLKPTARLRNERIFADFLSGRKRDSASWKNAYLNKPVLRILAKLIVWDQNGSTFTLDNSGQAVTAQGTPYTITDAPIAVAHPMEIGKDATEAWQKYYTDRRLKQPFEQVWEPIESPEQVKPGRYDSCEISMNMLRNRKRDGIDAESSTEIRLKGCHADLKKVNGTGDKLYELKNFRYDKWNRQVNHIVTYLDKCTVSGRIKKDDISAAKWFDRFTLAQITAFIDMASEAGAHNVLMQLLEYKHTHYGTFDPMKEFTLDL